MPGLVIIVPIGHIFCHQVTTNGANAMKLTCGTDKRHLLGQILLTALLLPAFFGGTAKADPPETVLFLGSSTISNWGIDLQKDFPFVRAINRGIGGTTYADLYNFSPEPVKSYRPGKIVLYSGDNDLAAGTSPQGVAQDFTRSLDQIRQLAPNAEIFVISIKPSPGRWNLVDKFRATNELIRRISEASKVKFVDVFPSMLDKHGNVRTELFDPADAMHIHMNRAGYELWTSILTPYLKMEDVALAHACADSLR